jgi:GntR family transcriptional regulator
LDARGAVEQAASAQESTCMNSVVPVYHQIKQTIRSWLINKEYSPGEKIPSEMDLMKLFDVSRFSIRHAISQLAQEGFLVSKRGEGTFVSANEKLIESFNAEFRGFLDDILPHGSQLEARSVVMTRLSPPRLVKEKLELDDGVREVMQIERVRFLRGRHFTYTINYLPIDIGAKVTAGELYKKPLMRILEQDVGVRFADAIQTMEATFANQEVAAKLAIASGSPVLFIEKIMYTQKHRPVELFQSWYRGDLCKFIVRFKNVRSRWVHNHERNKREK